MKRIFILFAILFLSCRNEYKLIPEEELGEIIVQSVVAESFLRNTNHISPYDSISYFLPILDKYDYTAKDVEYTIERMVQRKSNVFGQLMDKISVDVRKIKDVYEARSNVVRMWRDMVKKQVYDTLYFSPDTIRITSGKELKRLDYRVPINHTGEVVVKYNYRVSEADSNYSRYMTYTLRDSLSKRRYASNNYWLNKSNETRLFEKDIVVSNNYKGNVLEVRVMSYTPNDEMLHPNALKSVDFYIDSVTILLRPDYEEAEKRLMRRLSRMPILSDIRYIADDSIRYITPYNVQFGSGVAIEMDSVRYDKKSSYGEDPKKVKRKK